MKAVVEALCARYDAPLTITPTVAFIKIKPENLHVLQKKTSDARLHAVVDFKDLDELGQAVTFYTRRMSCFVSTRNGDLYRAVGSHVCHVCKKGWPWDSKRQLCLDCSRPICSECSELPLGQRKCDGLFALAKKAFKRGLNICEVCGKDAHNRCQLCGLIAYCSVTCQRNDWPRHRELCSDYYCTHEGLRSIDFKQGVVYCSGCGEPRTPDKLEEPLNSCTHEVVYARWREQWNKLRAKNKTAVISSPSTLASATTTTTNPVTTK